MASYLRFASLAWSLAKSKYGTKRLGQLNGQRVARFEHPTWLDPARRVAERTRGLALREVIATL
jgi:hypothetical protein